MDHLLILRIIMYWSKVNASILIPNIKARKCCTRSVVGDIPKHSLGILIELLNWEPSCFFLLTLAPSCLKLDYNLTMITTILSYLVPVYPVGLASLSMIVKTFFLSKKKKKIVKTFVFFN